MRNKSNYIDVTNLSFSYDLKEEVIGNISFSVSQGETTAIVGGSGSGKSTILKLLSSILTYRTGNITINGLSPIDYKESGLLSFMFQETSLLPHLTVFSNIALPIKINKQFNYTPVNNLIEKVGLSNYRNYMPNALSGGMKTRVALARSFISTPELLLLDEPFSALDISWKSKLYEELVQLQEQNNTTVVLVTHDIQEAILLSDNVLVLGKSGRIIGQEKVNAISPLQRIRDVNHYMASNEYQTKFVKIQKLILDDGVRYITELPVIDNLLDRLNRFSGNSLSESRISENEVIPLRHHSDNLEIHSQLLKVYDKAVLPKFKALLIWDILNYSKIDRQTIDKLSFFALDNSSLLNENAQLSWKISSNDMFDYILKHRINNNEFPRHKKWIYLYLLIDDKSKYCDHILDYLNAIIDGDVDELNYETARVTAERVKKSIELRSTYE